MKPLSADITPEIQLKHYEMMRRLSPGRRLKLAFDLTETMRILILADIHYWNPDADEATLRRKFIARVLPRQDVIQAFGFDPETEDR
jgi:hypothetical protein